jgi:hypothetical protein
MTPLIEQGECIQGSDLVILAYVATNDGNTLVQSDVESITITVVDKTSDAKTITGTYTPDASDCVTDTLQQDGRWRKGGDGFNFSYTIPGEAFVNGDAVYRVQVLFTFLAGGRVYRLWELECIPVYVA